MTGCDFSNVDIEQATGLEFLTEETEFVDQSFGFDNTSSINISAGANFMSAVGAGAQLGGSMSIRSVNGTSITDLGWVRITSEGGGTGVSSFGGLRSNNGQYLDTRVADIRMGNGILRLEVIGAGRIRCSIRDVNSHVTGEMNELILEAGHNVDINGDFNMNIENRYKK